MPWSTILAGGAILVVVFGIRHSSGLFLGPIEDELAIGRADLAFGIAAQNLIWGLAQPFAGRLADRYGSIPVLGTGVLLYSAGLVWLAGAHGAADIQTGFILFCGLGLAGASFSVTLATVGKRADPARRSSALGLTSTGGSIGQFIMTPVCFGLLAVLGWRDAFIILAVGVAVVGSAALLVMRRSKATEQSDGPELLDPSLIPGRQAIVRRGMTLLCLGFFVCGFQVVFIMTHLPSFLADRGLAPSVAATALSLIGLFNIAGTLGAGWLGDRYRKSWLLSGLYGVRALAIGGFAVITPLNDVMVYGLCIVIGSMWLATVPLTSGLTADFCRRGNLATAFGVVFLSHQTGAFFGAWTGGWWREQAGSYEMVWAAAAMLGLLAALLHVAIPRAPAVPAPA